MIKKILLEPLLHFILIAVLFFVTYDFLNPTVVDDKEIVVSNARVTQLQKRFEKTWQRQPTTEELNKLLDVYVMDEIYTQEARSLGLDKNDGIIRKRLRQKMEFMLQDISAITPPTKEELAAFYQQHAKKYRDPAVYSFSQVYISTDKSKEALNKQLTDQIERIANNIPPEGDRTLLPQKVASMSEFHIERKFGETFIHAIESAPLAQWHGPVDSGIGLHFVYVSQKIEGYLPGLETKKEKVINDWRYEKNQRFEKAFESKLLEQYRVRVEKPEVKVNRS